MTSTREIHVTKHFDSPLVTLVVCIDIARNSDELS
jgi:hypothetical protein